MVTKSLTRDIILETAVRLIDENNGIKDVTLRHIAKKLGCAHTSLYNYFDSLDDIFWESLGKVIIMMLDHSEYDVSKEVYAEEKFLLIMSNIIDFSIDHPGWYKLIWLETLNGNPSDNVRKILEQPIKKFTDDLMNASNNVFSQEKAKRYCDILLRYLHGELCVWINNRNIINNDRVDLKGKIISNLRFLYNLLINS